MAYIGFGSILCLDGHFQWQRTGSFTEKWVAAMQWYGGIDHV